MSVTSLLEASLIDLYDYSDGCFPSIPSNTASVSHFTSTISRSRATKQWYVKPTDLLNIHSTRDGRVCSLKLMDVIAQAVARNGLAELSIRIRESKEAFQLWAKDETEDQYRREKRRALSAYLLSSYIEARGKVRGSASLVSSVEERVLKRLRGQIASKRRSWRERNPKALEVEVQIVESLPDGQGESNKFLEAVIGARPTEMKIATGPVFHAVYIPEDQISMVCQELALDRFEKLLGRIRLLSDEEVSSAVPGEERDKFDKRNGVQMPRKRAKLG